METLNYLVGYENLKVYQDTNSFHFSLDSILLPRFVTINPKCRNILDIGTGNAVIPLILSTRTKASITAVEIQEKLYQLGCKSINYNRLNSQIHIIHDDIRNYADRVDSDQYDVITCNPPYFKISDNSHFNLSEEKTLARHEILLTLEDIMKISRKLLKNNGLLAIVQRPERLIEILMLMRQYHIEPKKIQLIYPKKQKDANILLIEGRKNGRVGLKILPPVYTHQENGEYTLQMQNYLQGEEKNVAKKL